MAESFVTVERERNRLRNELAATNEKVRVLTEALSALRCEGVFSSKRAQQAYKDAIAALAATSTEPKDEQT